MIAIVDKMLAGGENPAAMLKERYLIGESRVFPATAKPAIIGRSER